MQEVQSQFALRARDIVLDDCFIARGKSIDNQMDCLVAFEHQQL
nr:hypothetical protein [Paraburkholderia pallida]